MKKILLSLFMILALLSCEDKMSVEKINELEAKVFTEGVMADKESLVQLVEAYLLFAEQNPDAEQSPNFVFKALDVAVGTGVETPEKSIAIADVLIEKYPDFDMTPMAMFIKGFVYENKLGDLQNAEVTYRQFIEKYPNDPMVADVEASIKNIGIPLDELIKTFEQ